jgi:hypothetical protein
MDDTHAQGLTAMAKLAIALLGILLLVGMIWNGVSVETWQRMWHHLFERPDGPMSFRFILQPIMAAIAAIKDARTDAQADRRPYFWGLLTNGADRKSLLNEGLVSTARIILLGLGMDLAYQLTVFRTFYPVEAVNIAVALAFLPYLLIRGPAARVMRWWSSRNSIDGKGER